MTESSLAQRVLLIGVELTESSPVPTVPGAGVTGAGKNGTLPLHIFLVVNRFLCPSPPLLFGGLLDIKHEKFTLCVFCTPASKIHNAVP